LAFGETRANIQVRSVHVTVRDSYRDTAALRQTEHLTSEVVNVAVNDIVRAEFAKQAGEIATVTPGLVVPLADEKPCPKRSAFSRVGELLICVEHEVHLDTLSIHNS
jgi:hypothetical protein